MTNNKDFIISNIKKPCIVCKKETNLIDIYSEQYICSEECLSKIDTWWFERFKNMLESDIEL